MRQLLTPLGILLTVSASAQVITPPAAPDTSDWQGWTSITLDWKPVKGVKVALEEQWRVKRNFGRLDRSFHQLSVGWTPQGAGALEAQSIALGARVTSRLDDEGGRQGFDRFFRWHLDHEVKWEPGRWGFQWRTRLQERSTVWKKGGADVSTEPIKRVLRGKFSVGYDFPDWKLDPEVSAERFWAETPDGWPADGAWRVRLGTGFKPGKRQKLKLFLQREWVGRYLPQGLGGIDDFRLNGAEDWAIGVAYRYRMKTEKKKDEG